MADNTQAQTLTLNNGNAAQNQYLSYYNQLIKQIGTARKAGRRRFQQMLNELFSCLYVSCVKNW